MKRIRLYFAVVLLVAGCSSARYQKLRGVHDVWYTIEAGRVTIILPTAQTNDAEQAREQLLIGAARVALANGQAHFWVESTEIATDQAGYGETVVSMAGSRGLEYTSNSEIYYPNGTIIMGGPGMPQGYTQEIAIVGAASPRRSWGPAGSWKSVGTRAAGSVVIRLGDGEGALDAREILHGAR